MSARWLNSGMSKVSKEQFKLESLILPEQENTLIEYYLKAKMCLSICQLVTDSP